MYSTQNHEEYYSLLMFSTQKSSGEDELLPAHDLWTKKDFIDKAVISML